MERTARRYIRILEEELARRSDRPQVFSQKEYRLALGWYEAGIPAGMVLNILAERKIPARSLAQVAARVEDSWKAVRAGERPAGTGSAPPEPSPVSGLEDALSRSGLPEGVVELLASALEAARRGASAAEVEALIDRSLPKAVPADCLRAAEEQAREALADHRSRMPEAAYRQTLSRGVLARLRRLAGIPRR